VENYSYFQCPDCGKQYKIFGESKLDAVAMNYGLPVLARLPIDPETAKQFDEGNMEQVNLEPLAYAVDLIAKA